LTGIVLLMSYSYFFSKTDLKIENEKLIDVALLTVLICVYFLPGMHERYLYTADVLAIVYLFIHSKRWILPLLVWLISQNGYAPVLWGFGPIFDPKLLALVWLGLIGYLTWDVVKITSQPPQENPSNLPLHPTPED
jgi:Gpi18-like mannosyltransferase